MHILELIIKNKITTVDLGYAKFKLTITKYMPDPNAWGLTDTNTQTIHILDCMDNQQAREVIIHEITHAMFEVIGYTSEDPDKVMEDTNEDMTIKVSRGLMMLMNLNPKLFELLIKTKD